MRIATWPFIALTLIACGPATPGPATPPPGSATANDPTAPVDEADPWAVVGSLGREKLPAEMPKFALKKRAFPALPKGVPAASKDCARHVPKGVAPKACDSRDKAIELLDAAVGVTDAVELQRGLSALDSCTQLPAGMVRALRAERAPTECADVIVASALSNPPAGMDGAVYDALFGLGLAGMLRRAATVPPKMSPPYTKDAVKAFIDTDMMAWSNEQAAAIQQLAALGAKLKYYGKAVVAVEAGMADMRFVHAMRKVPVPEEFAGDEGLRNSYLTSLEVALDPRKRRGRDAALVGLGMLATIGVIRDERVQRARGLLSKMFGGSPIDALDALKILPLAPATPANAEQRLASRLQTFYASLVFPAAAAKNEALLRMLIENGISLPHRIALASHELSAAERLLYARARFELGQNYWRAVDIDETVALLSQWPADEPLPQQGRLLLGLGLALRGGPANAAEMMERVTLSGLGIGRTSALDNLVAEAGPYAGKAAFDSALIAQLAAPAGAGADYWRDVAERFRRAAAAMADAHDKREAETRAREADETASAIAASPK